jgi:tetratricopeptide (TPR) repeat protein
MTARTLRLRPFALIALAGLLVALPGCGGGGAQTAQTLPPGDRNDALAPRDSFEASQEVVISADTHCAAGRFAENAGNLPQAMDQYQKALKLRPNHPEALFRTAVVQVKMRNLPAAIETWNKYVNVTRGDATAYANLGFAYELSGRTHDAEMAYLKAIKRDPANIVARTNYGLMLARKERFNEATLQLQTVMTRADVHYNLASVLEELGRREQAKIEYRKALDIDPQMADAKDRLAALQ